MQIEMPPRNRHCFDSKIRLGHEEEQQQGVGTGLEIFPENQLKEPESENCPKSAGRRCCINSGL